MFSSCPVRGDPLSRQAICERTKCLVVRAASPLGIHWMSTDPEVQKFSYSSPIFRGLCPDLGRPSLALVAGTRRSPRATGELGGEKSTGSSRQCRQDCIESPTPHAPRSTPHDPPLSLGSPERRIDQVSLTGSLSTASPSQALCRQARIRG